MRFYALLSMMTFVEHHGQNYPPFVWGTDICVSAGPDELEISAFVPFLKEDRLPTGDALWAYRRAISQFGTQKRQGTNSPHIKFANADDDQKLTKFVEQFGPVVASSVRREERTIPSRHPLDFENTQTILVARQDLAELRDERRVYHAALVLMNELRLNPYDVHIIRNTVVEIVEGVNEWPSQWERERRLRESGQGYAAKPEWSFHESNRSHLDTLAWQATRQRSTHPLMEAITLEPIDIGHYVICELINAFSPLVYPWGRSPVEAPSWDLTCGIRPILYYILRREYLQAGCISICRNTECRNLFEIERFGQEFCGDMCSRRQRQREYWQSRGKGMRKARLDNKDRVGIGVSGAETEHREKRKGRKP